MKQSRRVLRWGLLLWKRLYKKLTFLVLLALIPILIFSYGIVAEEDSGIVTVALATKGETVDELTRLVWNDLQDGGLIRYVECTSPEQARQMVLSGEADTAWIFEAELERRVYDFAARRVKSNAFVTVLEPESRVLLKLLREVLSGTVFPYCSESVYLVYIRENAPELDHVSDEKLLEYYHGAAISDGLFETTDVHGNVLEDPVEDQTYLMAPVRGMLAVVAVLAGFATAMYYIRDEENGTFACMSQRKKPLMELGCQLISVFNVLLVVLISLIATKQAVNLGRELLLMPLYAICVAAFSMMVRRIAGGMRGLGMVAPLLVVVMLVVCPVFFDLNMLRWVRLLFPPTYFVAAAYDDGYILYMLAHTVVSLAVCRVIDHIRHLDR